jgi:DNA-binding transcriptional MerR regulator
MDLDEFLEKESPATRSKLAPWLKDIQTLRSKGYTLEQVRKYLAFNGVTITVAGLSAYLRRRAGVTRRQAGEHEARAASVQATPDPASPAVLDKIMGSAPDLDGLAKAHKRSRT